MNSGTHDERNTMSTKPHPEPYLGDLTSRKWDARMTIHRLIGVDISGMEPDVAMAVLTSPRRSLIEVRNMIELGTTAEQAERLAAQAELNEVNLLILQEEAARGWGPAQKCLHELRREEEGKLFREDVYEANLRHTDAA